MHITKLVYSVILHYSANCELRNVFVLTQQMFKIMTINRKTIYRCFTFLWWREMGMRGMLNKFLCLYILTSKWLMRIAVPVDSIYIEMNSKAVFDVLHHFSTFIQTWTYSLFYALYFECCAYGYFLYPEKELLHWTWSSQSAANAWTFLIILVFILKVRKEKYNSNWNWPIRTVSISLYIVKSN